MAFAMKALSVGLKVTVQALLILAEVVADIAGVAKVSLFFTAQTVLVLAVLISSPAQMLLLSARSCVRPKNEEEESENDDEQAGNETLGQHSLRMLPPPRRLSLLLLDGLVLRGISLQSIVLLKVIGLDRENNELDGGEGEENQLGDKNDTLEERNRIIL